MSNYFNSIPTELSTLIVQYLNYDELFQLKQCNIIELDFKSLFYSINKNLCIEIFEKEEVTYVYKIDDINIKDDGLFIYDDCDQILYTMILRKDWKYIIYLNNMKTIYDKDKGLYNLLKSSLNKTKYVYKYFDTCIDLYYINLERLIESLNTNEISLEYLLLHSNLDNIIPITEHCKSKMKIVLQMPNRYFYDTLDFLLVNNQFNDEYMIYLIKNYADILELSNYPSMLSMFFEYGKKDIFILIIDEILKEENRIQRLLHPHYYHDIIYHIINYYNKALENDKENLKKLAEIQLEMISFLILKMDESEEPNNTLLLLKNTVKLLLRE